MEALADPRNFHILLEARTARSWKIPQTVLRGRKDDGTWHDRDRVMALALTMYEDGLCSGCGLHRSATHGLENVGRWGAAEEICHGCVPIDSERDADKKETYPGKKLRLVDEYAL